MQRLLLSFSSKLSSEALNTLPPICLKVVAFPLFPSFPLAAKLSLFLFRFYLERLSDDLFCPPPFLALVLQQKYHAAFNSRRALRRPPFFFRVFSDFPPWVAKFTMIGFFCVPFPSRSFWSLSIEVFFRKKTPSRLPLLGSPVLYSNVLWLVFFFFFFFLGGLVFCCVLVCFQEAFTANLFLPFSFL